MTNQEQTLLQAISDMMDEKLEKRLDEILERILDEFLEKKLDRILDEKLDKKLEIALKPIKTELADLNRRVGRLEVTQDTVILPLLREISSCYLDTYKRYQRDADRMEQAFEDIDLLKKTVEKHSAILQNSFA